MMTIATGWQIKLLKSYCIHENCIQNDLEHPENDAKPTFFFDCHWRLMSDRVHIFGTIAMAPYEFDLPFTKKTY